jgi:hypothetical protein
MWGVGKMLNFGKIGGWEINHSNTIALDYIIYASVADVLGEGLDQIHFRRTLFGESLKLWNHIKDVGADVIPTHDRYTIKGALEKKSQTTDACSYEY